MRDTVTNKYSPESAIESGYLKCGLTFLADDNLEPASTESIHVDSWQSIRLDCERFSAFYHALVEKHKDDLSDEIYELLISEQYLVDAGYDFWLTRNGHAPGFLTNKYIWHDLSVPLTKLSRVFSRSDLYVGDDNQIYYETQTPDKILNMDTKTEPLIERLASMENDGYVMPIMMPMDM